MAIPIINNWKHYFIDENEGLGSSYERVVINNLLRKICHEYGINTVLEAPLFGFTGLSGINSMELAKQGKEITLVDNNSERLVMVEKKWEECKLPVELRYSELFTTLPFSDDEFDMCWNFSALWFVDDLERFLSELDRITRKVILIMVPNRKGIGFLFQRLTGTKGYKKKVNLRWIKPSVFSTALKELGWQETERGFIDSPPWPDIGMKKEILFKKLCLGFLLDKHIEKQHQTTIMDYYRGVNKDFPQRMMKYYHFEKLLPNFLKQFWAHHQFHLFIKTE